MSYVSQKRPFASMVDDEDSGETPRMSPSDMQFCQNTMKVLKRNKRSVAFQNPVDPVQFNILDYFDIIKHPMDLGTIDTKLEQHAYPSVEAFLADVQLIFDNCYLYNNEYDPVTLDAKKLEESFKRQLKKVPPHVNISHILQEHPLGQPIIPVVTNGVHKEQSTSYTSYPEYPVDSYPMYTSNYTTDTYNSNHDSSYPSEDNLPPTPPRPLTPPPPPPPATIVHATEPKTSDTYEYNYTKEERQSKPTSTTITTNTPNRPLTVKLQLSKRQHSMPEDQYKRCEAIVKELKKPKYQSISWPFLNPVDADAWGATDYYEIIKHPMDMSTYEKKLRHGEYDDEEELAQDIRLMFRNCYAYNPPGHDINKFGHQLEQVFEKYWDKLHQNKKKSSSKKRQTSHKEPSTTAYTDYSTPLAPEKSHQQSQQYQQQHVTVDHSSNKSQQVPSSPPAISTSTSVISSTDQSKSSADQNKISIVQSKPSTNLPSASSSASGRSNILRLKIPTGNNNNKKEEPVKVNKPSLALSKEPTHPKLAINTHGPKLSIGKPPSPIASKKPDVLPNHDKWAALAKNVSSLPPPTLTKKPYKISPPSSTSSSTTTTALHKSRISPPPPQPPTSSTIQQQQIHRPRISPPPKVKEVTKGFDIVDLYSQIKNGARLREEEEREKQEKFEKEERIRLEKERVMAEEKMKRLREFNIHAKQLRAKDREIRLQELSKNPTDISRQKMMFSNFERKLSRDSDWSHMYHWQRDTVNYRHLPVPAFIKRSGVNLSELRGKLLSKCVRLENSKSATAELEQEGDSDMDIE